MKTVEIIPNTEATSTLEQKICFKYKIVERAELILGCNERKFLYSLQHIAVFSLAVIFYRSRRMCLCMENRTPAAASAPYTLDPFFFIRRLQVFFPALEAFPFRIFQCLLIMNNCFY